MNDDDRAVEAASGRSEPGSADVPPAGEPVGGPRSQVASGNAKETGAIAPRPDFPREWRALAAAGDRDIEALLGRYDSPRAVARALKDLRTELSRKGRRAASPGKDATPDEIVAWRHANGVPATWQGYESALALPEAMVLGEADTPVVEGFFQAAHVADMPQRHVDAMLGWYFGHRERQEIARHNDDADAREAAETELRAEWGDRYGLNVNTITAKLEPLFRPYGADLFARLLLARLPDGHVVGDDARIVRALSALATDLVPGGRTAPAESAAPLRAIASRKAEIEAIIASPDAATAYWDDETLQKEYRRLLAAEARLPRRVA